MKLIVVESSHAGYEATQTLLKEMPEAEIHLYESGQTASFLSCRIQSYLEDVLNSIDEINYANDTSYKKQGVNLLVKSEINNNNPDQKTVKVKSSLGKKEVSFDKLYISPWVVQFQLPVPGN